MRILRIISFIFLGISLTFSQRVIGYYPQWVQASFTPDKIDYSVVTHVLHSFAWPDEQGNILHYDNMLSESINNTVHENGAKILLVFGGWGQSWGFPSTVSSYEVRAIFINNIIDLCETYGYDGIDIDWEQPVNSIEKNNLTSFITELREAFDATHPEWIISMAIPVSNWSGQHYDFTLLKQSVDFFNAMTYDIHGSWTSHAGHNSPLYPSPPNDPEGSMSTGIDYLVSTRGIEPSKVNAGIPFYGKEYNTTDINQPFAGGDVARLYNEYHGLINNGWEYVWDNDGQVPYLKSETQNKIITIDDSLSVSKKSVYAISKNLGGLMIWALGYDYIDGDQKLIQSMKNNYLGISSPINPGKFSLDILNYPNPFNAQTKFKYDVEMDAYVSLIIYDLKGVVIKTLISEYQKSGSRVTPWDGTTDSGGNISAGVYLYRFNCGDRSQTKKIIFLK